MSDDPVPSDESTVDDDTPSEDRTGTVAPEPAEDEGADEPTPQTENELDTPPTDESSSPADEAPDASVDEEPDTPTTDEPGSPADETPDASADAEFDSPADEQDVDVPETATAIPEDVRKYEKFQKIDGSTYDRANEFLRDRTYITAREWAMARLCADFRTETGVEMTKIGENLPHLVPFMTDTYSPQAVNQARHSFEEKVRKSGATFLYGAMCDFFTAEELDDVMYEATEVAKFLLEVEGVDLTVEEELDAEDRISEVMRDVREHSVELRHDEVCCPECGHEFDASDGAE